MPNRSFFLKIEVCFSKVGVCFYRKSEFVFWQAEYAFIENQSLFFENRSLFFGKSEFVFFENRGLIFGNRSLSFLKIGVCFLKIRVLAPDSELPFCSWVRTKSLADPGKGAGNLPPRPRLYFWTKLRPEGPKKNFLETIPLLISGSGWPPSPLSEGLYSSFRSHMEISDLEDLFKSSKLRIPAFNY